MSSAEHAIPESSLDFSDSAPVPESFIVYPLIHGAYDLHPVREHEWQEPTYSNRGVRFIRDGETSEDISDDPNSRFLAHKLKEGFRQEGQYYWPSRTIDRAGRPLPYLDPRDERHAERTLRHHTELIELFGSDSVVACRPSRDHVMSPDRAPIDEVIFLVRGEVPLY